MPVYILNAKGSWANRPLESCTLRGRPVSRPGNLLKRQVLTQSNPARAAQSLTSVELLADTYDAECPYLFPRGG